eukprot:TRINITY_DN3039_c0_g1_i1.p1 TRINITY_DN3039_c0_g1~~TRINITY_DN3039_c0_g1_i1.p1  ORF type:complete len:311 (+),score=76.24 TRINITY_DN3039_c0_g1_i1:321-1253(+)
MGAVSPPREFVEGKKHGYGVYTYADGSIYQGDFFNDNFHGRGRYTYADGEMYEGDFVNDVFHGHGEYLFSAGDRYKGAYENDMMHGSGTYTFKDGRQYNGEFREGRFNGKGIYTYPNGSVFEGEFTNDQKNGTGVFTDSAQQKYREVWKAGNRLSRTPLKPGTNEVNGSVVLEEENVREDTGPGSVIQPSVLSAMNSTKPQLKKSGSSGNLKALKKKELSGTASLSRKKGAKASKGLMDDKDSADMANIPTTTVSLSPLSPSKKKSSQRSGSKILKKTGLLVGREEKKKKSLVPKEGEKAKTPTDKKKKG